MESAKDGEVIEPVRGDFSVGNYDGATEIIPLEVVVPLFEGYFKFF